MDVPAWLAISIVLIALAASGWIYALCRDLHFVQCKILNRKMNNSFHLNKKNDSDLQKNIISNDNNSVKSLSTDDEIALIQKLLEKKFNRKFQIRVKVDGYLGENDMNYTLVMDDYCNNDPIYEYHSIYGDSTKSVLNVRNAFLKGYWRHVEKGINNNEKDLDSWDAKMVETYRNMAVANSREELLIHAELEGIG